MEKNTVTVARINLFAILRNIEDLCSMDSVCKDLIKDKKLSVQFRVPQVGIGTLKFENGACTFVRGECGASLKLYFTSPEHFNKLIDGENTVPIFYNVFQVGFLLKEFMGLADRIKYYLQPTKEERIERCKDPEYFKVSTTLLAYTAFFAMSEIANSDPVGKLIAGRIPEGIIQATIADPNGDVGISLDIDAKGHLETSKGCEEGKGRAFMKFEDVATANAVLNGDLDVFTPIGEGKLSLFGYTPMLDNMSKLLGLVSKYVG